MDESQKCYAELKKPDTGASLVVQWVDSMLPMQGAWVQSLVGELDPTCMLQLRVRMPQLKIPQAATTQAATKIPRAATKTWCTLPK